MKKLFLLLWIVSLLVLYKSIDAQTGIVNHGAKIIVSENAKILIDGGSAAKYTNLSSGTNHGSIDLDGEIELKGNWINNATSGEVLTNLGDNGVVTFSGASLQTIEGTASSYFESINLNNSSGLQLYTDVYVNEGLTLTNGVVDIGSNNLTFGSSASVVGTFGTNRMIIANSSGEVRKNFSSTGTFTFPIGDSASTVEYSPIVFSLVGYASLSSAYISANLVDAKHPENTSPSEYLTRYWTLDASGISSPTYNASFYYTDSDIVGTEANIYGAKFNGSTRTLYNPVVAASNRISLIGATSFSDFTGVDGTSPSVLLSSSYAPITNTNPFSVTIEFSEEVSGFSLSDIVVGNGTASNLQTTDDITYTIDVAPASDGNVTIDIPPSVAKDIAGNNNTAASQLVVEYDATKPVVDISYPIAGPINSNPFSVDIIFNEHINGFTAGDVSVANGVKGALTTVIAGLEYSLEIVPVDGTVTVDISANSVTDDAGNGNIVADQFSIVYDGTAPEVITFNTTENSPTNNSFVVNIGFSEPVNGFALGDITVTNGNPSNLTSITPNEEWTVLINPTSDGVVTVNINGAVVTDNAGNNNIAASTPIEITYDATAPTLAISTGETPPATNGNPFAATFAFDEGITNFVSGDVTLTNATISNFTAVDHKTFTADINPIADGEVRIEVYANTSQDSAGNNNIAAAPYSIDYDGTAPTVAISGVASPTNLSPFAVTIVFSEEIDELLAGELSISNGTASNMQTSDNITFTADITPAADGSVTVRVPAGAVFDIANNANLQSNLYTVEYDGTRPSVAISSLESNPTNNSPFEIAIDFSEEISGFNIGDIQVINASIDNLQTSNSQNYTANITPSGDATINVNINAGVAQDQSGNTNTAASTFSITYDGTAPTIDIATLAPDPTNSAFSVTMTFSEDVAGFTLADIDVLNGTASNFSNSTPSRIWTADINPSTDGTVTVTIQADKAFDLAGNGNLSGMLSIEYDETNPTIATLNPADNATLVAVDATLEINFSEVVNFGTGNITLREVSGGAIFETIGVNSTQVGGEGTTNIIIDPSTDFGSSTEYYVQIDASCFQDQAGNSFAGISATTEWNFETADVNDPVISSLDPVDNSLDVAVNSNLEITFSEAVNAQSGNITILRADDVVFETISVTSGQVSGTGTSTITINPSSDFDGETSYYVLVDATAFDDLEGNSFPGISSKTYWNFTTEDIQAPQVLTLTPYNGEPNVIVSENLEIEFDEVVNVQSGLIIIREAGNQLFEEIDVTSGQVTGSGTSTISIDPTTDFESETSYYVLVGNSAFTDQSGNNYSGISSSSEWTFSTQDITQPSVVISTTEPVVTNSSPFVLSIDFDEEVTGFSAIDIAITNGSASNLQTSDNVSYTTDITPDGDGAISIYIPAGVVMDLASNPNIVSNTINLTYDGTAPEVSVTSTEANPTNSSPFVVNILFTEAVTGFETSDMVIVNGSASNQTVITPNVEWTYDITPTSDGIVTINILNGAAIDEANNSSLAATEFEIEYDATPPNVVISTIETSPTNNSPFLATFSFDEDVNGFTQTDIAIGNGVLSNFTNLIPNQEWSAEIAPSAEGTVTLDINAGVATDIAGNGNNSAAQLSLEYDVTPPSVVLTSIEPSPTNNSPFEITATFSEEIINLGEGDFSVTNGTCTNVVTTDNIIFTAEINPSGDGDVMVAIPVGVTTDIAGNINSASNNISINFDGTSPEIEITCLEADPTNNSPFEITITFTEEVVDFEAIDIAVFNGVASNLQTTDNIIYTANITPNSDGLISIDISADAVTDLAGNGNIAASQFSIEYDGTNPEIVISSTAPNPTNITPIPVSIEFSEEVIGFELTDIVVGNGTASNMYTTNNMIFTIDLTPSSDGSVTVDVASGVASDIAGNLNNVASQFSIDYNASAPGVFISSTAPNPTNTGFEITMEFTEEVTDFIASDISITNGTASNLQTTDNIVFTADIAPISDGIVGILVPANAAQDLQGNGNIQSNLFEIAYDITNPSIAITSTSSNPTNTSPIDITITFTEEVTGFELNDLIIGNGTANNFTLIDSVTYYADITPDSDGEVLVDINAGEAHDLAGNPNNTAPQFSIVFNSLAPGVAISSLETDPTNTSPFEVTVEFTEEVTGFQLDDFVLSNGAASNLQTSNNVVFTADITPVADGIVTVNIPANVAVNLAGTPNTPAPEFSITYDGTIPTVEIYSNEQDSTGNSPFEIIIEFSEEIIGFDVTDLLVGNGTPSNIQTSDNIIFTADITPDEDGVVSVDIESDAVQDLAGNYNSEALQFTIYYDDDISVEEIEDSFVKIYSNNSYIYIEFVEMTVPEGTIRIFNVNGQKVIDKEIENSVVNKIWMEGHKAIYFVKVNTKTKGSQLQKVFVK